MSAAFGYNQQNQKSDSVQQTVDITPGVFREVRGPQAEVLKGLLSGGASNPLAGIPTYTGEVTAPVGKAEQDFLSLLQNQAGGVGSNLLADTVSGKFTDPASNPFLDAYIKAAQRPTLQGLEETLTRALPGRFTQAGQFVQPQGSSAFDRAAAIATRGVADAVADIATKIGFGAYDAERGRQQEGIKLGQSEVDTTIKNLQAQALPRMIQQYGLDVGLQEFRNRLNALLQVLGIAGQTTRVSSGTEGSSHAEGRGFGFNVAASLGPGAGSP